MKTISKVLASGIIALSSLSAQANVIDFSSVHDTFVTHLDGFNFAPSSGWVNGTSAPLWNAPTAPSTGYIWSNGGAWLEFSTDNGSSFDLNSLSLYGDHTKWGGQSSQVTILGYNGANLMHTFVTPFLDSLTRGAYTSFNLDWMGITTVKIQETPNENVLISNIVYNAAPAAVPVPGAAWLMGSMVLGFFGIKRRPQTA